MSIRYFLFAILVAASAMANADDSAKAHIAACNKSIADGDAAKALESAQKALRLDKNSRDAMLCQGRAEFSQGRHAEAINALKAAEALSANANEHMIALTLIGNVQRAAKHSNEALTAYRHALGIAQDDGNKQFQYIELNLIGDTLIESGEVATGLESYQAASQFAANDNERGDSYGRIAAAYSLLKQHPQAIEFQIKAMLMEQQSGDLDHIANANLELGRIYTVAEEYPNAEKAIAKVVKLAKEQGGPYWEAKAYYYLALIKIALQKPQDAKPLLSDARQISAQVGADALNHEIIRTQDSLPPN